MSFCRNYSCSRLLSSTLSSIDLYIIYFGSLSIYISSCMYLLLYWVHIISKSLISHTSTEFRSSKGSSFWLTKFSNFELKNCFLNNLLSFSNKKWSSCPSIITVSENEYCFPLTKIWGTSSTAESKISVKKTNCVSWYKILYA